MVMHRYRSIMQRRNIVNTGIASHLFNEMDNITIKRHIRVNIEQLDTINNYSNTMGLESEENVITYIVNISNQNSFREISDKFNISQSWAHEIIVKCLDYTCGLASKHILWPSECEKRTIAGNFKRTSGQDRIIGAIDGRHISIQKPKKR